MNKKQLYESIMKNVAKEVKKAINEAEKEKELDIIDYILGESLIENTNKSTMLLRFKLIAKKGLLTTAIIFAVLPKMSANDQAEAIKYISNNNISIEMSSELSKQNYETIEVEGESTNEQLARNIAFHKAHILSAKGYQITTNLKLLHNSETNCYKYVITLVRVANNRNTPPPPVQTPPPPMPAN